MGQGIRGMLARLRSYSDREVPLTASNDTRVIDISPKKCLRGLSDQSLTLYEISARSYGPQETRCPFARGVGDSRPSKFAGG